MSRKMSQNNFGKIIKVDLKIMRISEKLPKNGEKFREKIKTKRVEKRKNIEENEPKKIVGKL